MNGKKIIMIEEKKISVIIPYFNSASYLDHCIKSVIYQSYKNLEILLIDDGSKDASYDICKLYASSDKRIKIIRQNNRGSSSARNLGIKNATGYFIFFLDSDDWIYPHALKSLVVAFNKFKAEMIVGDFTKVISDNEKKNSNIAFDISKKLGKNELVQYSLDYLTKPNKYEMFSCSWGKLFQSSIIKKNKLLFNTKISTFEDVLFNYDYLKFCPRVYFLKSVIYDKTMHDKYSCASKSIGEDPKRLFGFHQALDKISKYLKNNLDEGLIREKIGHAYIFFTIFQLIRICGQITDQNKNKIYEFARILVKNENLRKNLKYYKPSKEYSKIIPLLLKLNLTWLLIIICKYKAFKRYGYRKN